MFLQYIVKITGWEHPKSP